MTWIFTLFDCLKNYHNMRVVWHLQLCWILCSVSQRQTSLLANRWSNKNKKEFFAKMPHDSSSNWNLTLTVSGLGLTLASKYFHHISNWIVLQLYTVTITEEIQSTLCKIHKLYFFSHSGLYLLRRSRTKKWIDLGRILHLKPKSLQGQVMETFITSQPESMRVLTD